MYLVDLAYKLECDSRSLYRHVAGREFQLAYAESTPAEKKLIEAWVREVALDKLMTWTRSKNKAQPSLADLKEIARRLRIKNWSRLSISQLTLEIDKHGRTVKSDPPNNTIKDGRHPGHAGGSGLQAHVNCVPPKEA